MVKNSGKTDGPGGRAKLTVVKSAGAKGKLDDDVDALFRIPLAEFTAARNTLAAQLKKGGSGGDADLVKALAKPSISAWTVNQLYWKHREPFDRLIESGVQFHKAQSSGSSGKIAEMRSALDLRREALMQLSDLATSLLRDAGHNPTPDTIHRITTTLEAMSAYSSRADAPRPGRLTQDVDPPGFESFASFVPSAGMTVVTAKPAKAPPSQKSQSSQKSDSVAADTRRKVLDDEKNKGQLEATRKAKLAEVAAAKALLQEAKKALIKARDMEERLKAKQKKVEAEAKEAEKTKRQAEEQLEKARTASDAADQRVRSVAVEVEEAATSVENAERTVEKLSEDLEKLSRESAAR